MKRARLHQGRAEEQLAALSDGSIDLVLADPPYDIGVAGVRWDRVDDYMRFARAWLTDCVRVLRPAGALLLYGSPCRVWMARMTLLLVDELGMRHVQDMPWVYTQGASPPPPSAPRASTLLPLPPVPSPPPTPTLTPARGAQAATLGWST